MQTIKEKDLLSQVPIGAIFRHYKGKEYKILHIGRHSEDLSYYVIYQGLYHCDQFGKISYLDSTLRNVFRNSGNRWKIRATVYLNLFAVFFLA